MLSTMRQADEHAFRADDPVAQYWLHNCVGFGVRGLRSGPGVVRSVSTDGNGEAILTVRRGVFGGTAHVSAARVDRVDPWDETIVLRPRDHEGRRRRALQARGAAGVVATAARGAAIATAFGARLFFDAVAKLLLALAALTRRHAPGARERAGRLAAALAVLGRAYAAEARRAYNAQKDAVSAWRAERRHDDWGDESAPTRAGADEVDARSEEQIRS
jgi:hypothetical protein